MDLFICLFVICESAFVHHIVKNIMRWNYCTVKVCIITILITKHNLINFYNIFSSTMPNLPFTMRIHQKNKRKEQQTDTICKRQKTQARMRGILQLFKNQSHHLQQHSNAYDCLLRLSSICILHTSESSHKAQGSICKFSRVHSD